MPGGGRAARRSAPDPGRLTSTAGCAGKTGRRHKSSTPKPETVIPTPEHRARGILAEAGAREDGRGPLARFLHTETSSSALLLAATLIALIWANSPLADAYEGLWGTHLQVSVGGHGIDLNLRHWVNDGLMALFFYVVGLEIRRELSLGELTDARKAAVPAIAALGGMVVPALIYVAINPGGEAGHGWGIVMATDIAFVLGALAVVGQGLPTQVRVFLLTLAIVDDIGAIVVIAVFYSDGIDPVPLALAAVVAAAVLPLDRLGTWRASAYAVAGTVMWFALHESGVHATIAGVVMGLLTSTTVPARPAVERAATLTRAFRQRPSADRARAAVLGVTGGVSPNERFQLALHPVTSFVIVPLFALANAGVALGDGVLGDALTSPVTLGIIAALVVGKLVGITVATLGAVRLGVGPLPRGVRSADVLASAGLAGIGFTVSLFITDLAFSDPDLRAQAKVGVLLASVAALVVGGGLFAGVRRWVAPTDAFDGEATAFLDPPVEPAYDRIRGTQDAPSTLVVFGSYGDPDAGTIMRLAQGLTDRSGGRLRWVLRHLPDPDRHELAALAHEAVEAAGRQGRFWAMHDRVLSHPERLELDDLLGDAQAVGLDIERFAEDLRDGVHVAAVAADEDSAAASGVVRGPALFLDGEPVADPSAAGLRAAVVARLAAYG